MVAATPTPDGVTLGPPIEVPPSDARLYRRLTLSNGMAVLLISDPAMAADAAAGWGAEGGGGEEEGGGSSSGSGDTDASALTESDTDAESESDSGGGGGKAKPPPAKKAAAALSVAVGSLCDPLALPGLAHYLEHMLFMGSAKYPDENE